MLLKLNPRTLQLVFKRTMAIDIGGMRKPYLNEKEAFDIKDLVSRDPYAQFTHWFEEAKKTAGIEEANAMCIGNSFFLLHHFSIYRALEGTCCERVAKN